MNHPAQIGFLYIFIATKALIKTSDAATILQTKECLVSCRAGMCMPGRHPSPGIHFTHWSSSPHGRLLCLDLKLFLLFLTAVSCGRYFTVPCVLLLLFLQPASTIQLNRTITLFCVVNAATIYVFLCRPFVWADGSVARFMW